ADLLEERFHHVLRFALVQADLLEKQIGQLGLRQRHHRSPNPLYLRRLAENSRPSRLTRASRAASASASVRVRSVSCITTRKARLFRPTGTPGPWYRSKGRMEVTIDGFFASIASISACDGTAASTTKAMSRTTGGYLEGGVKDASRSACTGSASSSNTTTFRTSSYFCSQRGCSSPIQPTWAPPTSTLAARPGCSAGCSARS